MNQTRVLIVDDEPLARDRIRALLRSQQNLKIVGEAGNGPDALNMIARDTPDVVFLDMQMPGCDGLEVAEAAMAKNPRPAIVFVTAHDRFAVEAFSVRAVDYVLKPFDQERLLQSLQRATAYLCARRNIEVGSRLENLLTKAPPDRSTLRIAFRVDGRIIFVDPEEIVWIEAANNYSILHLSDQRRLMPREPLATLEARLGETHFVRINRSTMVQINQVKELEPTAYGDYAVVMQDGTRFPLSRNLRGKVDRFLPPTG